MSEKNKTKNDYVAILFKPIDNNEENVRIFGREFVKNNKHKCYIEYKDKKFELCEYFEDIDNNYNHKDEILFFLIGINHINNMSYLFADCNTLSSLLIFSGNDFMKNLDQLMEIFQIIFCQFILILNLIGILQVKMIQRIFIWIILYFL